MLKLTDAKMTAKAVELRPCSKLEKLKLPPGTKIQLTGCAVRSGVILLEDKSIKVAPLKMSPSKASSMMNIESVRGLLRPVIMSMTSPFLS